MGRRAAGRLAFRLGLASVAFGIRGLGFTGYGIRI